MNPQFLLSDTVDGYVLACQARRLSPHTISDYTNTLNKFIDYTGDKYVDEVTRHDIRGFLAVQTVSNKTLLNYHTGLSAFYKWAITEELADTNPTSDIERPRAGQRMIQPIPKSHIQSILSAANHVTYTRHGKQITAKSPYKRRHRAMILLLLNTGMRVSELCSLTKSNLDLSNKSLKIIGKRNKERILYFSPITARALWKYKHDYEYVFVTDSGRPLDRNNVRHIIKRLCKQADVPEYSPHDFRHTFAVNLLRNYPNIYALQQMLGHSTLDMVKRYLAISERDVQQAHKHASPVENWGL